MDVQYEVDRVPRPDEEALSLAGSRLAWMFGCSSGLKELLMQINQNFQSYQK
jgi:hypothetical protein